MNLSQKRDIEGASAHLDSSVSASSITQEMLDFSSCPEELQFVIENTSLCQIVHWKLQHLLDGFDFDEPNELLKDIHAEVEKPLFAVVLKNTRGNQSKAAEVLGCNRNTLHRKLKKFTVVPKEFRKMIKGQADVDSKNDYSCEF